MDLIALAFASQVEALAIYGAWAAPLLVGGLVSLVLFVIVLVDMVRRPTWQWRQAGSSKAIWLSLEIALFVLFGVLSIISSIVYLASARPRLVAAERAGEPGGYQAAWRSQGYGQQPGGYGSQSDQQSGPYGPGYGQTTFGHGPGTIPDPGEPSAVPAGVGPQAGQPTYETPPQAPTAPPSWQPDPSHRHELRYWDGSRWTEHVADAGQQSTDPPTP